MIPHACLRSSPENSFMLHSHHTMQTLLSYFFQGEDLKCRGKPGEKYREKLFQGMVEKLEGRIPTAASDPVIKASELTALRLWPLSEERQVKHGFDELDIIITRCVRYRNFFIKRIVFKTQFLGQAM